MGFSCWHHHSNFYCFFLSVNTLNFWPLLSDVLLIQSSGQIAECHCNDVLVSIFFPCTHLVSPASLLSLLFESKAQPRTYVFLKLTVFLVCDRNSDRSSVTSEKQVIKLYNTRRRPGASSQATNISVFSGIIFCVRNPNFGRSEQPAFILSLRIATLFLDHKWDPLEVSVIPICRAKTAPQWHGSEALL